MLALLSEFGEVQEPDGVRALKRCDAEIAEISTPEDKPAWLTVLGIEDWEMEKRLIEAER
jgi:hypothetical protein